MTKKQIMVIIICLSFFSYLRENRENTNGSNEAIAQISAEAIDSDEIQIIREDIPIIRNLEGYYWVPGDILDTVNLVFIAIEENYLVIYRFNVINGQYIYEELTRFDIYSDVQFVLENDSYKLYTKWILRLYRIGVGDFEDLHFISSEINDHLLKYTYDHQKQYVGIYHKYSITYDGITEDEINARDRIQDILVMNIKDGGALFITDELGNGLFGVRQVILDEKSPTIFFDHHPGNGSFSYGVYVLNGAIHYWFEHRFTITFEEDIDDWEINEWEYTFEVVYKRNN